MAVDLGFFTLILCSKQLRIVLLLLIQMHFFKNIFSSFPFFLGNVIFLLLFPYFIILILNGEYM